MAMPLLANTSNFVSFSDSPQDYRAEGAEDQLQEIIIVSYEAALEAGLKPAQALTVLQAWAASERLRLEDQAGSSPCDQNTLTGFFQAA